MIRRLVILAAAIVVFATPAAALHRESPPSIRITAGPSHVLPPTRSWGNYLAFPSTGDLLGRGATGRQVYVWNLADFDCNRGTTKPATPCANPPRPDLVQVTDANGPLDPDNGSATGNGSFVAYDALGIGSDSSSRHRQVFVLNRDTKQLSQITQSGAGDSVRPTLNKSGGLIVFESNAPLLGPNTAPRGVFQLYAYIVASQTLLQLTNGQAPSGRAMPAGNGEHIVFESTADLLGDGHDTGITQIFVSTIERSTLTSRIDQITNGNAPSRHPYITEGTSRVVFESTATDFEDSTPGPGSTIYAAPVNQGSFPPFVQMTNAQYGSCTFPAFDASGLHLTFICDGDPLQNGTTGQRLFLIDLTVPPAPGTFALPIQLTGRGNVAGPLTQNLGVNFVAFSNTADISDTGGCGLQLHVIDFYTGQAGHWRGASAIGELPPDLLPPPPPPPDPIFPVPATNYLGTHKFELLPISSATGSFLEFTTRDGSFIGGVAGSGAFEMHFGYHDAHGEATVLVPRDSVYIPPVSAPGFGVMCIELSDDARGVVDCDGGRSGGDFHVVQDHETRDVDGNCQIGCAEDAPCQNGLLGPHREPCATCPGGTVSACNGPINVNTSGALRAGGLQLFLPMRVRISVNPGLDRVNCTEDDTYRFRELESSFELTTETVTGSVIDADAVPGAELDSLATSGDPLDCAGLKNGKGTTIRLNGVIPVLDVPTAFGLRDVLLGVNFEARSRPPNPRAEVEREEHCAAGKCTSDAQCNDGNPCNGVETCSNFACVPGPPLCDDGDPCNGVETCDPTNGQCGPGAPPNCDDGNPCTFDTCVPGTGCTHLSTCDDDNACNGVEKCDPRTGACTPGTPPVCNDGNSCTTDTCDPQLGCVFTNNSSPCDDNDRCTIGDACSGGACAGTPVPCSDDDVCNGVETCDPATGNCRGGTPLACDDGNPCTDDSCDPVAGCQHVPNVSACDDNDLCTVADTCVAGTCTGTPAVICVDDGDPCDGAEHCDPGTGVCTSGPAPTCDDGNPCTTDSCTVGVGCAHTPSPGPCDDGNPCTTGDTCDNTGFCSGTLVPCSDNDVCNGVETCDTLTAACIPGTPLDCDDGNPCTSDTCDAAAGCQHTPIAGSCSANLVLREIKPLLERILQNAPDSLGGGAVQGRLGKLLKQVTTQLQAIRKTKRTVPRRKIAGIQRKLRSFIALLDTTRAVGGIDPVLAQQLIDGAAHAIAGLDPMMQARS